MNTKGAKDDCVTAQEYRDQIRIHFKNQKDFEGYMLAQEFNTRIKKKDINFSQNDEYASHIYLSRGCWRLKIKQMATYHAKLALKYALEIDEVINARIMLAICYQDIGKVNNAIEMYRGCLNICNEVLLQPLDTKDLAKILECKARLLGNIGGITKSMCEIEQSIYIYNNILQQLPNNIIKKEMIIDRINNAYKNIFEIYLEKGDYINSHKTLAHIICKETKQTLRNKMFEQNNIANIL